jgi:hypothetical protein
MGRSSALQEGDRLRLSDDSIATVGKIRRIGASNGSLTTYNFTVADHHTYFVGKAGVWVHNACPPDVEPVLCKFRTTYKKRPGPGHTELDDFLDFHKKEKLRESNLPQPPAVSSVLDDNKFGMAAYKLSTAVLWGLVPTLALVEDAGPGRSRQQVMDDMLAITSAEALGLQALKAYLEVGGKARTQGGWDVHHIPEKWIWNDLNYGVF